jgi:predicted amidophosphoribosyltransferase
MRAGAADHGRPAGWASRLLEACRQALFPPRCLVCRAWLMNDPAGTAPAEGLWAEAMALLRPYFCPGCLQALMPLAHPLCACCGTLVSGGDGPQPLCASCRERPPAFDRARAAFAYQGSLREVVQCLKYRGKTQLARPLGRLMHAVYRCFWQPPPVDLILPVPLHRRRLRERGFNQALLLMRRWPQVAGEARVPVDCGVLVRTRATAPRPGWTAARGAPTLRARSPCGTPSAWPAGACCWWMMSSPRVRPSRSAPGFSSRAGRHRWTCWPWRV